MKSPSLNDSEDYIPLSHFCSKELRSEWIDKSIDLNIEDFMEKVGVANVVREVTNPTSFQLSN